MARRKKKNLANGDLFSFDFSALTFGGRSAEDEDWEEIPKLTEEPAAFENAEYMADTIDYSKDYFAFVPGNFVFGDFLEALIFKKQLCPSEVYITTLGMSQDNIDSIVNLVDYLHCKKVNLIVSHYFAGVERHKLMPYMRQEFAGKPIDVAVLQSHCKITLIFSHKGNVMIDGSANLSSSNNVEQFNISHDETKIAYTKRRLDNIMQQFTVFRGLENKSSKVTGNTGKRAFGTMMKEES